MATTVEQLTQVLALLRSWGVRVTEEPGWQTRCGKRLWTPCRAEYGVEHWTASPYTSTAYLRDGDPVRGLGTLCNVQVKRTATLHLIAGGYANHAGYVDPKAPTHAQNAPLDREVIPGADSATYSANGPAIGMEGNAGPGNPYTPEQHAAATAWWAACAIVFGWRRDAPPVLGHKEITRRKPGDPSHDMAARRRAVAALIADKTQPTTPDTEGEDMPLNDDDLRKVYEAVWFGRPGAPLIGQRLEGDGAWPETLLGSLTDRIVRQQVAPLRGEIAGLQATVSQLATGQPFDLDAIKAAAKAGTEEALEGFDVPDKITYQRAPQEG